MLLKSDQVQGVFYQKMELSKLDPDWQAAYLHGISTMPGLTQSGKTPGEQLVCPCCLNPVDKTPAPLCENSKELEFLGFGFPLFYVFLKYCIILLVITTACYNAIVLYWAMCDSPVLCARIEGGCSSIMVQLAKISEVVDDGQIVVRVFSFVIQLLMLIYIRDLITKTKNYYNERTLSLSEFSIIVTGLPHRGGTRRNLQRFLKCCFETPYHAYGITFLPEHDEYYAMEEEKEKIIEQMKEKMRQGQTNHGLEEKLMEIQCQIHLYRNKELRLEETDQCPTEKLIFSCATEAEKKKILSAFDDISEEKKREVFQVSPEDECDIWFADAPQPKEINWQHINYSDNRRVGRMIIGWLLTTAFLLCITLVFFFLFSEKSTLISESFKHTNENEYFTGLILVYLTITCVILFNKFVMGYVLHQICEFERHSTSDLEEFHFAIKYSVGLFFTTALMTLAVEDGRFGNFYQHPYGVIEQETIMFIMNSLFVPFIWMINPWHLALLFRRKLNHGRKDLTQKQANKLMENVQYNMGKRYAEIVQIMWFTYLYSSLIPLGTFLSTIGLCLYYWADKYNLLRRSSISSNIAGQLSIFSMKLLDFTLLLKPLGQIIFDSQIRSSYCLSSIVMCAIAILYLVLPIDDFLNYFHPERFRPEQKTFEQAHRLIKDTYQTLHPIFSLKKENQNKMYQSFQKSESNIEHLEIMDLNSGSASAMTKRDHHRDPTSILHNLFHRHHELTTKIERKSSEGAAK